MAAFGVFMTLLLMKYYVLPFQQAGNQDDVAFRFDWLSGEAIGAWGWTVLYGGLGLLMYWMVKQAYGSKTSTLEIDVKKGEQSV